MNKPAPFNQRQKNYLLKSFSSWFNVAEGGKRGGKNVLQTMSFCISLDEHPNKIHLISGVTTAAARLNILDCDGYGILNYFEGRCRTGQYQNRDCLYVRDIRNNEKIVLMSGGGKNGDEKLIKGNTYGMAYITEANECAKTFLKEVFDRTLSSKDRKVFHDLNPKSEGHWYYTEILNFHESRQMENTDYGYNYGHFTIADNLSVSDEDLKIRIGTYDKSSVWYQRDILGRRKQAEGLVYPMFNPGMHIVKTIPRAYSEYQISIDYGIQNATSMGLWGKCGDAWYRVKEYYHSGRESKIQKTDDEYYVALEQLGEGVNISKVIIDPSAASFIALIRKKGGFRVQKAHNAVLDGIQNTATALQRSMVLFNDCCVAAIREFGLYVWDEKSTEDAPVKDNDHAMDDIRYFVNTSLYGNKASVADIKDWSVFL